MVTQGSEVSFCVRSLPFGVFLGRIWTLCPRPFFADKLSVATSPGRAWCGHHVLRRRDKCSHHVREQPARHSCLRTCPGSSERSEPCGGSGGRNVAMSVVWPDHMLCMWVCVIIAAVYTAELVLCTYRAVWSCPVVMQPTHCAAVQQEGQRAGQHRRGAQIGEAPGRAPIAGG